MDNIQMHEMISALADGQLRGEALERVIQTIATDPQARTAWHTYHLIGDVLRTGDLSTGTGPARFLAGFQVRLERERAGALVSVEEEMPTVAEIAAVSNLALPAAEAANDDSFRWKLVAGFASFAAVAAIGWSALVSIAPSPPQQLAKATVESATSQAEQPAIMIRDPRLDEMLAAHRQFGGGASALQTTAGFLQNAAFDGPGR